MKERPILFSAPMVRAILEGRKTMTRRVVKLRHGADVVVTNGQVWKPARVDYAGYVDCPYGQVGDRLWVRESWKHIEGGAVYDAAGGIMDSNDPETIYRASRPNHSGPWKPSIHMPRWASRILLEVTGVRVEQLNEISEADAKAEGAMFHDGRGIGHSGWRHDYKDVHANARSSFARLWESINGPGSWEANPFVWVIEFKRIDNA